MSLLCSQLTVSSTSAVAPSLARSATYRETRTTGRACRDNRHRHLPAKATRPSLLSRNDMEGDSAREEESPPELRGGRARSNSVTKRDNGTPGLGVPITPPEVGAASPERAESKTERSNLTERELKALRKVRHLVPHLFHSHVHRDWRRPRITGIETQLEKRRKRRERLMLRRKSETRWFCHRRLVSSHR